MGRAAVAINVYGLLSDHSSYTQLAGALCHLGLFAVLATHHLVVLLGAVPQASCFRCSGTLGGRCDTPTHLSVQPHVTLQPISTGGETLASEKADGPGKGVPQGSHPGQAPFPPGGNEPVFKGCVGTAQGRWQAVLDLCSLGPASCCALQWALKPRTDPDSPVHTGSPLNPTNLM